MANLRKGTGALAALQLGAISVLVGQLPPTAKLFPATPTGFVTDAANLLDPTTRDGLEARLRHLQEVTGAEIAVVTLPTIGDDDPADVARDIGRVWKVGANAPIGSKLRNAGAVVLLVPHTSDHKGSIWISAGQGLEGIITDARAGNIRDAMLPSLTQQNYGGALDMAVSLIGDMVARDLGVQDTSLIRARPPPHTSTIPLGTRIKMVIYLLVFIIWIISLATRGRGGRGGGIGGSWIIPYMIGRSFGGGGGFGGGGFGGGSGGGGFGGFGGGGGFSGGGAGGSF
ncbi:MAG TPA: TPM domain-containing protein [Gemmatimonadales bacterium]